MEINGDVTMETNEQPESENKATQRIDKGLLTFASLPKSFCQDNIKD